MTKGEVYQVEKLLSHKPKSADRAKAKQYLVKWENYCVEEATWEPTATLKSAAAMIEEYWLKEKVVSKSSSRRNSHDETEEKNDDKIDEIAEEKTKEKAEEKAEEKVEKTAEETAEELAEEENAEQGNAVEETEMTTAESENEKLGDEEYIIEEIRATFPKVATCHAEVKKYLIKWEGYGDEEMTKEPALEIEETASGRIEEFWARKNGSKKIKKSPKVKSPKKKSKVAVENIVNTTDSTTKVSKRGRVIKPTSPMQLEPEVKKARITSSKSAPKITPPKTKASPASKIELKDEAHWQGLVLALKERVEELEIINRPKDRTLLIELSRRTDLPRSVSVQIKAHLRDNPIQ